MFRKTTRFFIALFFVQITMMSCSIFKAGASDKPRTHGSSTLESLRQDVTGWADNYIGAKYKYASSDPDKGFDCSGFTSYIMSEFQIELSPSSSAQSQQGVSIPLDQVTKGDLIFFGKGNKIQHVALVSEVTEEGIICVHATNTRGVVKENISTSDYWKKRILFARDVITPSRG
jgi:cell wall-associated NlpC family hydrolase